MISFRSAMNSSNLRIYLAKKIVCLSNLGLGIFRKILIPGNGNILKSNQNFPGIPEKLKLTYFSKFSGN